MEDDIIIGDRIRKIREDLKMSRETFSEMIDISDFFLGKIERGERSLSNNTLVKIVKFTGVSADYIFYRHTISCPPVGHAQYKTLYCFFRMRSKQPWSQSSYPCSYPCRPA